MFKFLEPYTVWIKIGAIVLLCLLSGYIGYRMEVANFEAYKAQQAANIITIKETQDVVTAKVEIKYIKGADRIRTITKEVIKEVPIRITDTCILSNGFVSLHNSASANTIPEGSSGSDAAPSGITVTQAATTIFENYGTCHEIRQNLIGLQEWVTEQSKVK